MKNKLFEYRKKYMKREKSLIKIIITFALKTNDLESSFNEEYNYVLQNQF